MPQTTNNITDVKPSKRKPQLITSNSDSIHVANKKLQQEASIAVSYNINKAIKKDKKIAAVDKIHDPKIPIKRPNKKHEKKLKNGSIKIHKYIKKTSIKIIPKTLTSVYKTA
jgi:hypothetical protein